MNQFSYPKIALISLQHEGDRVPPFGLVSLATYLGEKQGFKNIRIIDRNFEDEIKATLAFKPDLIGISAMTVLYGQAIACAQELRQSIKVPIIVGGVHISLLPVSLKKCFDIGVIGEGEQTMAELVELFRQKGKFNASDLSRIKGLVFWRGDKLELSARRRLIEDLDSIPAPDYNFIDHRYFTAKPIIGLGAFKKRAWVITARGCPYQCRFCATSLFWGGGRIRFHSPSYIVQHIKQLIARYDIQHILIIDDLFTAFKERLAQLVVLFEAEQIPANITLTAQARANTIDDELCALCAKLNIRILQFGFESGSRKILTWLKGASVSPAINIKAVKKCLEHKIKVFGSLMMGVPGEKKQDMMLTIAFIKKAIKLGVDYLFLFVATPYPGEELWFIAKKRGKVFDNMDFNQLSLHAYQEALLLDSDMSQAEFSLIFSQARKLLRPLKYKMVLEITKKNPAKIFYLVCKQPVFWLKRLIIFIFKH